MVLENRQPEPSLPGGAIPVVIAQVAFVDIGDGSGEVTGEILAVINLPGGA